MKRFYHMAILLALVSHKFASLHLLTVYIENDTVDRFRNAKFPRSLTIKSFDFLSSFPLFLFT